MFYDNHDLERKEDRQTCENSITFNNIDNNKPNDIYIKVEDLGVKIEETDTITTYINGNVSSETHHSNVDPSTVCSNSLKTNVWSKGLNYASPLLSECIKLDKIDSCQLSREGELNDVDNKTDDVKIKIEDFDIKNEDPPNVSSTFLNYDGKNQQESVASCSNRQIQNLQNSDHTIGKNLNNNENHTDVKENIKVNYHVMLKDNRCTSNKFIFADEQSKHAVSDDRLLTSSNVATNMFIHTKKKPYANKRFKCDVCNKLFRHLGNLISHKLIHTGEKPYKCDVCNRGFTQKSNLTIHKRSHTYEKPFKCDVCNKRFTISGNLVKHKVTHTGEKPYKCDMCDKTFTLLSSLGRHKFTHKGEKPYKCDMCNKCFVRSSCLLKHKRNVCNKGTISSTLLNDKFAHLSPIRNMYNK